MLKTMYVKRRQIHQNDTWGIQLSPVSTQLLRAHVWGKLSSDHIVTTWEWVCTGERVEGAELARLFEQYPICEFQSNEDLMWRIERDSKAAAQKGGADGAE